MDPPDTSRTPNAQRAEGWAHVRALVEEALALALEQRPAYLDASCNGDLDLRTRIERMVAACELASGDCTFLLHPAGELVAPILDAAASTPPRDDFLGRLTIALAERYRIERELGAGGMATVYLAEDIRHGRQVAVKVLHPELYSYVGPDRFLSEIKTTAALQHPHILPLFDSGTADGLLFYVMPLVDGETLRARIIQEKQLPVADVVRIASDVADALDYAHRRGVIHRDIKPENILLHEGRPVVADFGIALAVQSAGDLRTTHPGVALGTPRYMSPEQARGDYITARSDIYSLGAVTYEMLTGAPPFADATGRSSAARILSEEPRAILAQRKHVPPNVAATVHTALEKLAADRFDSASDFARALRDPDYRGTALRASGSQVTSVNDKRSRALVLSLVAACLVLAAVAARSRMRADVVPTVVNFTVTLPRDFDILSKAAMGATLAVSPDGNVVVFTGSASDGTRRLYMRALGEAMPRPLAGTDGGSQPFYSPDGKWIGFWAGGRLMKCAVEGGVPQMIVETSEVVGATWTSRDVIVYASDGHLYEVAATGAGVPKLLFVPDSTREETSIYPFALADGDHVLYSSYSAGGLGSVTIGIASLSARSGRTMGIAGTNAIGVVDGRLIYATRDDKLMAVPFDVSRARATAAPIEVARDVSVTPVGAAKVALSPTGTLAYLSGGRESQIVLIDASGATEMVVSERRVYEYPRFSPDGRRIAVTIDGETRSDVWILELAGRTLTRLSSEGTSNERAEWSPDSKRVLYRTDAGSRSSIWWRSIDLGEPSVPLLTAKQTAYFEAMIAGDGRAIVYQFDSDGSPSVGARALIGDDTPFTVAATNYTETQPRVSPDGRWVAFVTAEPGSDQVVVQPFPGPGRRVQVSTNGGIEPVWSRDGKRIFYRADRKFMAANVGTTPDFSVLSRDTLFSDAFVPAVSPHANYDVAPDGKRLLVLRPANDAQLRVVLHWDVEVRKHLTP